MPITIKPAPHPANLVSSKPPLQDTETSLLKACLQDKYREVDHIKESSFFGLDAGANIYQSRNGFVQAAIDAYSYHHHLRIRPEDVWFSILSQLSRYINANAESLRSKFVSHAGQVKLEILDEANLGDFATMMGGMIQANVVDPGLREWIIPAFSTTTLTDVVVASVIMMAQLQQYFTYQFDPVGCGLPSVTLLGQKSDWENIEKRLEKLASFGEQPIKWLRLLKPVLKRMVMSFDDPQGEEVILFWNRIAHYAPMGSGASCYSGWITAFCFWDDDGKCLYDDSIALIHDLEKAKEFAAADKWERGRNTALVMDNEFYSAIDTQMVPSGYASVPVMVVPNGIGPSEACVMVAGSVGIEMTNIGIPDEQDLKSETKVLEPKPRGSSMWKAVNSVLTALCQFKISRASRPPERTILNLNNIPPSNTGATKGAEVKRETEIPNTLEVGSSTKCVQSVRGENNTKPENAPRAEVGESVETELYPMKTEPLQLPNDVDTANLDFDVANLGEGNSQRSSAIFSYDPVTESFWTTSTVVGHQTITALSEPTVRVEEDTVGETGEVEIPTTPKRMLVVESHKETESGLKRGNRPRDTINPVTGWWIYGKK